MINLWCSFCPLLYLFCAEEFQPIILILKKAVLEQLTPKLLRTAVNAAGLVTPLEHVSQLAPPLAHSAEASLPLAPVLVPSFALRGRDPALFVCQHAPKKISETETKKEGRIEPEQNVIEFVVRPETVANNTVKSRRCCLIVVYCTAPCFVSLGKM